MLAAFLFSARLFFQLWIQSFRRRGNVGRLTFRGRCLRALWFLLSFPIWLIHWIGLLLDEIFFRGYRQVEIKAPVFILGVPRSGTTFLHRTLAEDDERFTSVATWEVFLAPSVTQRKFWLALAALDRAIGKPFARLLRKLESRLFKSLEGVHDISLEAAEEDYLLLLPLLSCFILFLPFPESRHIWQLARFDWETSPRQKQLIMGFYKSCLQKHLYVHGKGRRYLSKNAAFASWPQTLHATFPDAKFVICMREPEKAVPSLLGSLAGGASLFELDLEQGELPGMLVEMMRQYYRHLLTASPADAPIIPMAEMKRDITGCVETVYQSLGEKPCPTYRDKLLVLHQQADQYRTQTRAIPPLAADEAFYRQRFPWYYQAMEKPQAHPARLPPDPESA